MPRIARIVAGLLLAASCTDRAPSGPQSPSPRHASFSVLPAFQSIPVGGPTIRLARIKGVLTPQSGDNSSTAEARFTGDSAVLAFDVEFVGSSAEFTLELTAYDADGVLVFHSIQKITLKAGANDQIAATELAYAAPDASVSVIHVSPSAVQLASGASTSLSVSGTGAGGQAITPIRVGWSSRDPSVATVDENGGVVAGTNQGSTWIVARTATNVADSALVKVRAQVAKVVVSPASVTIVRGQSSTLSAELRDGGNHVIDDRVPTWSSSDPSVASVSATGGVQAAKIGTATVTATSEGKTASAAIQVVSPIDHIELAPSTLTFSSIGQTGTVTPKIVPRAGASVDGITIALATSNASVATVDAKGLVTATGNGSATITATAEAFTATTTVTLKQVVASVVISPKAASVTALGDSRTFTAVASDATGNAIQSPAFVWTSSDPTIATVAGGVAVAKHAGSATISASVDGKSDAATFTVSPTASLLIVQTSKAPLNVGETATLSASLADNNGNLLAPVPAVFTVSPVNVAQLSGNTLVATAPGVAHIVATGGGFTGTLDIKIDQTSLTVQPTAIEKIPGGNGFFTVTDASSSVSWTVNGIPGGNATYGTIDVEGFYRAPNSVPSPSTFDVCAVETTPALRGCSHVTIRTIPSAGGDIIVINDVNALQDGNIGNGDNRIFFKNLVSFTPTGARAAATKVVLQYGHSSQCGFDTLCTGSDIAQFQSDMLTVGISTVVADNSATIGVIPLDVRVLYLLTPRSDYSLTEVNNLKAFAQGGGRIVFIGENPAYYITGVSSENNLFADLGLDMANAFTSASCSGFNVPAANIRTHQTTTGVTSLFIPCGAAISIGPNEYTIAVAPDGASNLVPIIAAGKIDVTPLSQGESIGRPRSGNKVPRRTVIQPHAPSVVDRTGYGPGVKPP
jgi:uncharacterized protein YjdB